MRIASHIFLTFLANVIVNLPVAGQDPSVGRQIFLDSSLVSETTLERTFHFPEYHEGNPVVKADRPWELNAMGDPYAAPFSGGVWYDEDAGIFKMWYSAGGGKKYGLVTCYAESKDGVSWTKPKLDVIHGTNIVDTLEQDCVSVILDKGECDPSKRYKMLSVVFNSPGSVSMKLKYSADGIHWSGTKASSGELYDRCSAYCDPFRGEYVLSLKTMKDRKRARAKISGKDIEEIVSLSHRIFSDDDKYIRYWFGAESDDPRNPDFPSIEPQIYNHDAIAYEGLLLGFFTVWQGPENKDCDRLEIQKRNEVLIGYSKDGFNWTRECKRPFIGVDKDIRAWNAGNVQSTCGTPVIVGDSLYFYVSGRYNSKPEHDSNFSTGLATLRRDGFVSYDAGQSEGTLTTNLVHVSGKYLFVNIDEGRQGILTAEILDSLGNPIPGLTKEECLPLRGSNSTCAMLSWKSGKDLSSLAGKTVSIRFFLRNASIYSFWTTDSTAGHSGGYTAGGGPGLDRSGMDI